MFTGFFIGNVTSVWRGEDVPDLLPYGFEFWWRSQPYRHRPGGYSDGLSSPQFLRAAPDLDSRDWAYPAAVCHDGGYHDALELQLLDGSWQKITLTKDECDQMFKDLLDTLALTEKQKLEASAFYEAVHLLGQAAFNEGRNVVL